MTIFFIFVPANMKKNKQINQYNSQGNREGYWEETCGITNILYKGHYVNGFREGYWEQYWANGQLMNKGRYVRGWREGYWETYYSIGIIMHKTHYIRGEEIMGIFFANS